MYKFGRFLLLFGVLLTAVGLVGGFALMFGGNDESAKLLLGAVPVGFLAVFTGLVMTLLSD
jgi:hypothetical protein